MCHLIERPQWETAVARGLYAPPSLAEVGFIHFSRPEQVAATAARFFAGVPDLLVLVVALPLDELRWEEADGDMFPHLYRALRVDEVAEVIAFRP